MNLNYRFLNSHANYNLGQLLTWPAVISSLNPQDLLLAFSVTCIWIKECLNYDFWICLDHDGSLVITNMWIVWSPGRSEPAILGTSALNSSRGTLSLRSPHFFKSSSIHRSELKSSYRLTSNIDVGMIIHNQPKWMVTFNIHVCLHINQSTVLQKNK